MHTVVVTAEQPTDAGTPVAVGAPSRLTPSGQELVGRVMDRRRRAISAVLDRMSAEHRRALVPVLQSVAAAGGEIPDSAVWALGWTTR